MSNHKTRLFIVGLLFIAILTLGFLFQENPKNSSETKSNIINVDSYNSNSPIHTYVDKFNEFSENKILLISTFSLTDKKHYRTEYRLFDNAIAETGSILDDTIDIIYDYSKEKFRIYISSNNVKLIQDILDNTINIIDNTCVKPDIYSSLDSINTKTFILGKNKNITAYINRTNSNYDLMLEFSYNQ